MVKRVRTMYDIAPNRAKTIVIEEEIAIVASANRAVFSPPIEEINLRFNSCPKTIPSPMKKNNFANSMPLISNRFS